MHSSVVIARASKCGRLILTDRSSAYAIDISRGIYHATTNLSPSSLPGNPIGLLVLVNIIVCPSLQVAGNVTLWVKTVGFLTPQTFLMVCGGYDGS